MLITYIFPDTAVRVEKRVGNTDTRPGKFAENRSNHKLIKFQTE